MLDLVQGNGQTPSELSSPQHQAERRSALARLIDSRAFTATVLVVIAANAVVLGAQTYEGVNREYGDVLSLLNAVFLGVFVVELALRIACYGRRPHRFFRDGWNLFDFVVVAAAFLPVIRESSTLLRLARVARVVRVIRLLPDLRVLIIAITRSLPPLASMTVLTALVLFLYGMVGWLMFGDEDPEAWGNIGEAMLTLFVLLTLENFPITLERGLAIEPWSVVYFVSFVLVAAFIVLNVLIGVVLHSMEEAREIERAREAAAKEGSEDEASVPADLVQRMEALRAALDDLDRALRTRRSPLDVDPRPLAARDPR